jgi:hypothetical protein
MKKPSERVLLSNCAMAPDGTIVFSFHGHDYKTHTVVDSYKRRSNKMDDREWVPDRTRTTAVDGGVCSAMRRVGPYVEMSVYSDDPFEVIRRFLCLKNKSDWIPLFAAEVDLIESTIDANKSTIEKRQDNGYTSFLYYLSHFCKEELKYRDKA